jgi:NADPH:quinone reductase-like Zn-dependent oxidoreductase
MDINKSVRMILGMDAAGQIVDAGAEVVRQFE